MNASLPLDATPPAALSALCDYLHRSGSTLSATEALGRAVALWLAAEQAAAAPLRGYQWKGLFLPEGSKVRMCYAGGWFYADVAGDRLMFRGQAVSPRQMTLSVAGEGRNAWRDLWILRPADTHWGNAGRLRAAMVRDRPSEPSSPMEAMAAAAKSMSETLKSALLLVEHVDHHAQQRSERRLPKHRRQQDWMQDDWRAD